MAAARQLGRLGQAAKPTAQALIHAAKEMAVRPDAVKLLPPHVLPKTTSGKIQRRLSRQLYLEDRFRPDQKANVWDVLAAIGRSYYQRARHQFRRRDTRPEA